MKNKRSGVIVLLTILGVAPVFFGARAVSTAFSQILAPSKKEIVRVREILVPLELVEIRTDQGKIESGREFDGAHKDWLKGLAVTYKNTASKPIASATIYIAFPETKGTGSIVTYSLRFGPTVKAALNGERTDLIQPGETFTVSVDESRLPKLKDYLVGQRQSLDLLNKVELSAGFILYDDNTGWTAGSFRIQDPNRPNYWITDPKLPG